MTQSVAGTDGAGRLSAREKGLQARATASKIRDEADSVEVHGPEALDPARRLAKSGDEEAEQDRRQSGSGYGAPAAEANEQAGEEPRSGGSSPSPDGPGIDIQG
ncbi:MAG: hypothetical protein AB7K52_02140 [Phycisphaerales bacterium]